MAYIDDQLLIFKTMIEESIITGGSKGKESICVKRMEPPGGGGTVGSGVRRGNSVKNTVK